MRYKKFSLYRIFRMKETDGWFNPKKNNIWQIVLFDKMLLE